MSKSSTICITLATLATSALAQPQSNARPAPSTPAQPVSTQLMMQGSGGSLLQASVPHQTESASPRTPSYSLYAVPEPEPKVLKKHDLINIIVREESQSASKGVTDLKKNADLDAKLEAFANVQGTYPVEVKANGTRNYKGD